VVIPSQDSRFAPKPAPRVGTVDNLRGLASLAVCWFHLSNSAPADSLVKASGTYGRFGVDVFFVISGFVIPYALMRSGYRLADFWRFLAKRVVRVDPPYVLSIAATVLIAFIVAHAPYSRARFDPPSVEQLLLHLGYLVPFARGHDAEWLNIVYWTLAVEFQYYLVIGLAYPLVAARREWVAAACALGLLAGSVLFRQEAFFPAHAALFVLGIYVFRHRAGLSGPAVVAPMLVLTILVCLWTRGVPPVVAGVATAAAILFANLWARLPTSRLAALLGTTSYSLYLLHVPVGTTVIAIGRRLLLPRIPGADAISRLLAVVACVAAAYLLYVLVERPAQRLASRIPYRGGTRRERVAHVQSLAEASD
jgi:peptidoglycan/LPS O-acetylase OafA/YrhL